MISFIMVLIGIVLLLLGLIDFILGVLLVIQKNGYVRHLGIFLILSGLIAIYSNSSTFSARMGEAAFVRYSYLGLLVGLLQIAAVIFVFLFAKKRYNSRGLAIVIILPIAWYILHKFIQVILLKSNLGLSLIKNQLLFSSYAALSNLALIAVMIYITVIFYRNKDREQVFPSIWVFPMLFAISYFLNSVATVMAVGESAAMTVTVIKLVSAIVYPALGFYLIINMNNKVQEV